MAVQTLYPDLADLVAYDEAAAQEIGFSCPEAYNASRILFDNLAQGRGEKTAILTLDGETSYAALCTQACRIGNGLLGLGCRPNDRVVMVLEDGVDYAAAIFGALRAGLVPVLINTLSPGDLMAYFRSDSQATAVLTQSQFVDLLPQEEACPVKVLDTAEGQAWIAAQSLDLPEAATDRDDMAFWMYSSGSTGKPKGVVHLHHDMLYTVKSYADTILKLTEDDVCFSIPKIFFAYGFGNSLTFPFAAGAASALLGERPVPDRIYDVVGRCKPTVLFALPTVYTALVKHPGAETRDLSSVRLCISAAEVLSSDVFNGWKDLCGHEIIEGLGSTEVLHIYLSNTRETKKLGAAGARVPGYDIKLTDREGAPVALGEEGIMWVRGASNAPAYWNRPDKTADTMRDGWIWTGDRFVEDEDGFYFFRGRADDLVKVSGQWVYPLEVELCLADHPAVRECAVLALPMADQRMTLAAAVVPMSGQSADAALSEALRAYAKEKLLPYKYPRHIEYVDVLPKTGTDKIDRMAVKQLLSDALG